MSLPKQYGIAAGWGVGAGQVLPTLSPIELDPATVAYAAAAAAAGAPLSARRQSRNSRMMQRLRAAGVLDKLQALYIIGDSEPQWLINQIDPGTFDLTKVGTPVFEAGEGVSTAAIGSYYNTGIPLNSLSRDDVTMGVHIVNGSQSTAPSTSNLGAYDCGAQDGTAGLAINAWYSTDNKAHFRSFSTDAAAGTDSAKAIWRGLGWNILNRSASDKIRLYKNGAFLTEDASTAVTSAVTTPIHILNATGSTNRSVRKVAAFFVGSSLTDDQQVELAAATKDYIDCIKFGDPLIQEKGFGDSVITKDLIVYGLSLGAICCAYEAARLGLSVALVGDWQDETIWHLGGMPSNGLGWIDVLNRNTVAGVILDVIMQARDTVYTGYSGIPTAQTTMSIEARAYNLMMRRMLDPTRQTGTRLFGMDIPVYMTGGVASVLKEDGAIKSFSTRDGRTFIGQQFHDGSYDGDLIYYTGCPVVTGMEPASLDIEAYSGYDSTRIVRPSASGVPLNVDPYVTPATPASGLLPGVREAPAIADGAADPATQSMNYRLTAAVTVYQRWGQATLSTVPSGYAAENYETLSRAYAVAAGLGATYALDDVVQYNPTYDYTYDVNSAGQISVDLLNSGVDYTAAGADIVARQAVINNVYNWERGFFYWHRQGDVNIPAAVATWFGNVGLDTWSHLDPPTDRGGVFWPARAYIRDTTFMLQNAGFILNANDVAMPDGTIPRSTKTIASISYRRDIHAKRLLNVSGVLYAQGALSDSTSGGVPACGVDGYSPMPYEVAVPDRASCTNVSTCTALSMTKMAWASARMEPAMAQVGQFMANAAALAIRGNNVIQDVDYPTARAQVLSAPYTRPLFLPQVN